MGFPSALAGIFEVVVPAGYSKEIRFYAVQQIFKGRSLAELSKETGVSERTLQTWRREARSDRKYAAKRAGRPRRSKLDEHADYILGVYKIMPGISVREMKAKLASDLDVSISISALWDYLERIGLTVERRSTKI